MTTFDAPEPRRSAPSAASRTNTPLQALVTLNDPVYVEAAQALARRIVAEGGDAGRARDVTPSALVPGPAARATRSSSGWSALYDKPRAALRRRPGEGRARWRPSRSARCPRAWTPPTLAAWTVVGNVLLNLDETADEAVTTIETTMDERR